MKLQLDMDAKTAKAFRAAMTGDDHDVMLAMEKAAQGVLEQRGDFDPYDHDQRLWVRS